MTLLILAAALWVFVHVGISGTRLRDAAVAQLGEGRFMLAFSIGSVVSIVLLVLAWQNAETTFLWSAPAWLRWVLAILMLPAFVLFMASHKRNPTAVTRKAPKNTRLAVSPLPITCTSAQIAKDISIGWRVTRWMPRGSSPSPLLPTAVGLRLWDAMNLSLIHI